MLEHFSAGGVDRFGVGLSRVHVFLQHYRLLHLYLIFCLVDRRPHVALRLQPLLATLALRHALAGSFIGYSLFVACPVVVQPVTALGLVGIGFAVIVAQRLSRFIEAHLRGLALIFF